MAVLHSSQFTKTRYGHGSFLSLFQIIPLICSWFHSSGFGGMASRDTRSAPGDRELGRSIWRLQGRVYKGGKGSGFSGERWGMDIIRDKFGGRTGGGCGGRSVLDKQDHTAMGVALVCDKSC
jgi:hypothetical protein